MRGLCESKRRYRSGPHERPGPQGVGAEELRLFGDPAVFRASRENLDSYHLLGEAEFLQKHGIDLKEFVLRLRGRFWQQDVSHPALSNSLEAG
jgi:hypothetical protein